MTRAPKVRTVNALTGEISTRPSQFFKALSETDDFIRDLDDVAALRDQRDELLVRVQELEAELADLTHKFHK